MAINIVSASHSLPKMGVGRPALMRFFFMFLVIPSPYLATRQGGMICGHENRVFPLPPLKGAAIIYLGVNRALKHTAHPQFSFLQAFSCNCHKAQKFKLFLSCNLANSNIVLKLKKPGDESHRKRQFINSPAYFFRRPAKELIVMKYGVRNDLKAVVRSVKKGEIMAEAEFALEGPLGMTSIISKDSMDDLDLKPGDQVRLLVKAINVIPVKD